MSELASWACNGLTHICTMSRNSLKSSNGSVLSPVLMALLQIALHFHNAILIISLQLKQFVQSSESAFSEMRSHTKIIVIVQNPMVCSVHVTHTHACTYAQMHAHTHACTYHSTHTRLRVPLTVVLGLQVCGRLQLQCRSSHYSGVACRITI